MDLHVDKDGLHTIIHYSNQLNYCLFSPTGTPIRETIIDSFSELPQLSKIAGYGNNVYIVYKKGPAIHIKKSTDAGISWSNINDIQFVNYSNSNGLNVWTDVDGLHVVHSEAEQLEGYPYDTYYQYSRHNEDIWRDPKHVTDNPNDSGGFPSVTTSGNRIHVTFTDIQGSSPVVPNNAIARTRDRLNSSWQGAQQLTNTATMSYIIATNTKLHGFYYQYVFLPPFGSRFDLYRLDRALNGSWTKSQPQLLLIAAEPGFAPIDGTVSVDDRLHIV